MVRDKRTLAILAAASVLAVGSVNADKHIRGYGIRHGRSLQAAETGSTDLGCFRDSQDDRRFELGISGPDNSQQFCYDYCKLKGSYKYYGLQYGRECWCGVAGADYDGLGDLPQDSCRDSCPGVPEEDCGGRNAMQVFEYSSEEPTPTPAAGECYADVPLDRILADKNTVRDITIEGCKYLCEEDPSNAYYGLQYGVECWCGPASSDISRHGESDRCTMRCGGDDEEICGGNNAMNVYSIAPIVDGELGCYADVPSDRILGDKTRDSAMTPARCKEVCEADPANAFYGVQFANECWCGPASSDYTRHGESDQCTMKCAGDDGLICGGHNAMSMYTLGEGGCFEEREVCELQSDCCDDLVCRGTPDFAPELVKLCQQPLEPTPAPVNTCLEEREVCEVQSDCCDDLVCRGTPDFAPELVKLCQQPLEPTPTPVDTCLEEREVCEVQSDCCDDLVCRGTPDFAPELVKLCQQPLEPTPTPVDTCLEEREVCEVQSDCCDDLVCRGTPDFAPELVKLCQQPLEPTPAPSGDCKRAGYVCVDSYDCCTDLTCEDGVGSEKVCQ